MDSKDRLLPLRAVALRLSLFRRDGVTPNPLAVRRLGEEGQLCIIKVSPKCLRISELELTRFLETRKIIGEDDQR